MITRKGVWGPKERGVKQTKLGKAMGKRWTDVMERKVGAGKREWQMGKK